MSESELPPNSYGPLLKYWRNVRQLNQMELSQRCDSSARHLSCVETERAQPSRHLLLRLSTELEIPMRARNTILISAGYAPIYRETGLSDPEMDEVRTALTKILQLNEPFPAMVMNRDLDILLCNDGFRAFVYQFVDDPSFLEGEDWNLLQLLFDPRGLAKHIDDLASVYHTMIERARRNLMVASSDRLTAVLADVEQYRPQQSMIPTENLAQLIMPIHLSKDGVELKLFTLSATIGLPLNITLQEMHVECGYPTDKAGEELMRKLTEQFGERQ